MTSHSNEGELLGEPQGNSGRNTLITLKFDSDFEGEAHFTVKPIAPEALPPTPPSPEGSEA